MFRLLDNVRIKAVLKDKYIIYYYKRLMGRVRCFLGRNRPFSAVFNLRPDTDQIRSKYGANTEQVLALEKGSFGAVL